MQNLPEVGTCFEPPTTILIPEGAFQWNPKIEQWVCRISAEKFNGTYDDLNFLLQYAGNVQRAEGRVIPFGILKTTRTIHYI